MVKCSYFWRARIKENVVNLTCDLVSSCVWIFNRAYIAGIIITKQIYKSEYINK